MLYNGLDYSAVKFLEKLSQTSMLARQHCLALHLLECVVIIVHHKLSPLQVTPWLLQSQNSA